MNLQQRFFALYNDLSALKVADLETIYASDIEFIDPITTHNGIDAVKDYFAKLLAGTSQCTFDIHTFLEPSAVNNYHAVVEWTMKLKFENKDELISVDGVSLLKITNDMITYHRDYYDLGEMVYEQIPLLKTVIAYIKKKLMS